MMPHFIPTLRYRTPVSPTIYVKLSFLVQLLHHIFEDGLGLLLDMLILHISSKIELDYWYYFYDMCDIALVQ